MTQEMAGPDTSGSSQPSIEQIKGLLEELAVGPQSNLIEVLQAVQERLGYLPPPALERMSRRMRQPLARIYGVVSFYSQFYTSPRGRHTIRCCRGTACHVKGSERIIDAVKRELGIDEDQTTPDMLFYLETVACLGTCFLAPAMMIDNQYFGRLTPQRLAAILDSYRNDGAARR